MVDGTTTGSNSSLRFFSLNNYKHREVNSQGKHHEASEPECCLVSAFKELALNGPLLYVSHFLIVEEWELSYFIHRCSVKGWATRYGSGAVHHDAKPNEPSDVGCDSVNENDHGQESKWSANLRQADESDLAPNRNT